MLTLSLKEKKEMIISRHCCVDTVKCVPHVLHINGLDVNSPHFASSERLRGFFQSRSLGQRSGKRDSGRIQKKAIFDWLLKNGFIS